MKDRKKAVLQVAKRLFTKKSFSTTSVQDILDEAKISKGTFYNYFSSKNECLIAIIEESNRETYIRRQEIETNSIQEPIVIFSEQLATRFQVSLDHNLTPIFEAFFHSNDPELKAFVKRHYLSELHWVANRVIRIFGETIRPFAMDCAVFITGMIQHTVHLWTTSTKEPICPIEVVQYILRQVTAFIPTIQLEEQAIFHAAPFNENLLALSQQTQSKEQLLHQLQQFKKHVHKNSTEGLQYLQFLEEELRSAQPRIFILRTILPAVRNLFEKTPYSTDSQKLITAIWLYIQPFNE